MRGNWLLIERYQTMLNLDKVIMIEYVPKQTFADLKFRMGDYTFEVPIRKLSDKEKAILFKKLSEPGFKKLDKLLKEAKALATSNNNKSNSNNK